MSQGQPAPYKLEDGNGVKAQVLAIMAATKKAGKLAKFIEVMEKAGHRLRNDPNEWGDPEYRAKTLNATIRRGIIRPVAFRYAVYDDVHVVVLLSVRVFAEFD